MTAPYYKKYRTVLMLGLAMTVLRIIPFHKYNLILFSPVNAIAIFFGIKILNKKHAVVALISIVALSDVFLFFTNAQIPTAVTMFNYLALAAITIIGSLVGKLQRGYSSVVLIMVAPLLSSVLFFLLNTIGQWVQQIGQKTLIEILIISIPNYKGLVLGDVFYTLLIFLIYTLLKRIYPAAIQNQ
jgi:hypothetical protein